MNLSEDQHWLLNHLGSLVQSRGLAPLVASPIVEPNETYFPDPWEPSHLGVWRVCRRLLMYAGLGQYEVDIELADGQTSLEDSGDIGWSHESEGAAAWFYGIHEGTCLIGFDPIQIGDPDAIVGTLAHEVAHAYREHHQIVEADRDLDEILTDLTTIYLGFGMLTTNASYRYRSSGEQTGAWTTTEYSHAMAGYVPPELMAFLLAVQVALRDRDGSLHDNVAKQLEANQSAWFREASGEMDPEELVSMLHLPEQAGWPQPSKLLVEPLPEPPPHLLEVEETLEESDHNRGNSVFRVRNTRATPFAALGLIVALPIVIVVVFLTSGMWYALGIPVVLFLLGYFLGRRRCFYTCADPDCKMRLSERDVACPGCGGTVKGTIRHADERLAEEERQPGISPPR